jgi:alpha-galactosidase
MGIVVTEKTIAPLHRELRFRAGDKPETLSQDKKSRAIIHTTGALTIGAWAFGELLARSGLEEEERGEFFSRPLYIHCGGWQSWSAGWEMASGETLPRRVLILPELIKLTNRDGDKPKPGWLAGHFIMYIRSGDTYLCVASTEGSALEGGSPARGGLPPVSYRINGKRRLLCAEISCPGKQWRPDELMAELHIFAAKGFFNFKDTIAAVYRQDEAFRSLQFLYREKAGAMDGGAGGMDGSFFRKAGDVPGGYESWYNHYTGINEALILEDLEGLGQTGNLVKLRYLDRRLPAVFQIDDGWEKAVGDWEIDLGRFPNGLAPLAKKIEAAGYIPGLWLAPFIVTRRSRIFAEKPEWLLRNQKGRPLSAGFNHLWDGQYYCLDLSRADVLDYLDGLIGRVIDEWGFRYLKLDFLYAGLFNASHTPGAPYEHYCRACAVLTARSKTAAGLPVAYLGCGAPLGPSYRHFPLSRIGADTREEWDWNLVRFMGHVGRPGAYINLKDTIGRSFMNGTVYINDPDVIFLRSNNCRLSPNEKELIGLVNFLLAGQIMFSDDPLRLTEADLALARRLSELYDKLAGDEYGAVMLEKDVYRLESRSEKTTGLINLRDKPFTLNAAIHANGNGTAEGAAIHTPCAALLHALSKGEALTDHRIQIKPDAIAFAPHSITLVYC